MKLLTTLAALMVLVCVVLSCRMAETLTGSPSAGTVSALWTDVPPFDGATKADLEIPLAARLAIRAAMQGRVNFIAFTTTKSARDVRDFYSKERMLTAGWKQNEPGCVGDTESEEDTQGVVCFFGRTEGEKKEGLAIVVATDTKTKQTEIFYARIDASDPAS